MRSEMLSKVIRMYSGFRFSTSECSEVKRITPYYFGVNNKRSNMKKMEHIEIIIASIINNLPGRHVSYYLENGDLIIQNDIILVTDQYSKQILIFFHVLNIRLCFLFYFILNLELLFSIEVKK